MDASTIGVITGSTWAGGGEARSAESADGVDGGHAKLAVGVLGSSVCGVTDTGRGGKWKPVTGEARTGDARTGDADMGGDADGERSEAYGMSCGDAARRGEPCGCRDGARFLRGKALKDGARGSAMAAAVAQTSEHAGKVEGRTGPKGVGRPTSPSGAG